MSSTTRALATTSRYALCRRPNYKKPRIPRTTAQTPRPTAQPQAPQQLPQQTPQLIVQPRARQQLPQHAKHAQQDAELLPILASGVQADEWLDRLRQEYRSCPYFADVLTALSG